MKGRCGARTRSGGLCQKFSLANGRCRLHGGKSLTGDQNGNYKSGKFTKQAKLKKFESRLWVSLISTWFELDDMIRKIEMANAPVK